MSKKTMPTSKAKTAYGLLSEIAALAIEEPKRIRMAVYLNTRRENDLFSFPDYYPECGTVGCIAGWAKTLVRPGAERVLDTAMDILGLDNDKSDELFHDERLCEAPNQQTRGHARAVARHIRKFQQKYRAQLLAKKV